MNQALPELPHYREARRLAETAPMPAQVGSISFGTAGWTDPSLIRGGRFYPPGTNRPEQRLRYYAEHFSLVEVDATYYALLDPKLAERWVSWTPEGFCFNVKAHASLTGHPVDLARLPGALKECLGPELVERARLYPKELPSWALDAMWQHFEALLAPLAANARLGAVLMQFPPWFAATRGNARQLEVLAERFSEMPIAIEFRNPTWLAGSRRARVFSLIARLGWSYVIVDEPSAYGGGVPTVCEVTQPELAVFRLHGHNTPGWRKGASVAERFNYLYSPEELAALEAPVRQVAQQAKRVHVIFNNCVRDYAVVNAKDLAAILGTAVG